MLNIETFKQYWDKAFPDVRLRRSHFILAVSGGVDSVVLAHLMHSVNAKCTIAHVNFQLRGAESNRDEQFVRDYAKQINMPLQVNMLDAATYAATNKMGIQQAAREIRYAWFEELTTQINKAELAASTVEGSAKPKLVVLLTAHHANDQVETILMHLFRGTGLHGLTGIPERRMDRLNIARPLLIFSKDQIKAYAELNELSYVEDSSNEKDDYTRNLIRNKLLPELQTIFPMVNENILATSQRLKEAENIVNHSVEAFWKKGLKIKKGIPSVPIAYWNKIKGNATYTWGFIKHYGFRSQQIEEVHKILEASKGAYIASSSHKLINWNGYIQIVSNSLQKEYLTIPEEANFMEVGNGSLKFERIEKDTIVDISKDPNFKNPNFAFIDASKLEWPLLFRTWEPTDYFYPLGLRKKKKLNHFLGGLKLSPSVKSNVAVLCSSDPIFWVVGKRIDDRFKISPSTQQVLKISFEESI
jgi:tRNA(Ile)-lysidine synthase